MEESGRARHGVVMRMVVHVVMVVVVVVVVVVAEYGGGAERRDVGLRVLVLQRRGERRVLGGVRRTVGEGGGVRCRRDRVRVNQIVQREARRRICQTF